MSAFNRWLEGGFVVPMAGGCDEVKECVYAVVPEARVTLNARLFCEDVVVLTLEMSHDFREARHSNISSGCKISRFRRMYLASLSI